MRDDPVYSNQVGTTEVTDPPNFVVDAVTYAGNTDVIEWGTNWISADLTLSEDRADVKLSDWVASLRIKNTSGSESGTCNIHVTVKFHYDDEGTGESCDITVIEWTYTTPTISPGATYDVPVDTITAPLKPISDYLAQIEGTQYSQYGIPYATAGATVTIELRYGDTLTDTATSGTLATPNLWMVGDISATLKSSVHRQATSIDDLFESITGSVILFDTKDTSEPYFETKVFLIDAGGTVTEIGSRTLTFSDIRNHIGGNAGENIDLKPLLPQTINMSSLTSGVYTVGVAFGVTG